MRLKLKWNGWTVFLAAFILAGLCLLPFLVQTNGYFTYFGDYNIQQLPFYTQAHRTVRSGQFFINMQTDLGSSLWSSYSFYLMGSPFFWITVLFPEGALPYLLPWLLVIKIALATMFAYFYMEGFVAHKRTACVGAFLYGFSGYAVMNLVFNHFSEVIAFFPLLLLLFDRLVQKKKRGFFALAIALAALMNYYFFIAEMLFLAIYFVVRYLIIERAPLWKSKLRLVGGVMLEAVLGTCTACVLFIPSLLAVATNARVGQTILSRNPVVYSDIRTYLTILKNLFLPPDGISQAGLFTTRETTLASVSLFLPLFALSGVIAYFLVKRKKDFMKILLLVCAIFMLVPVLNSLFSGGNAQFYARWFFMPLLFMAIMTARSIEEFDKKAFSIGTLVCLGALLVFFIFSFVFVIPNAKSYRFQLICDLVGLLFLPYLVWLSPKDRKYQYLNGFTIATILVCGFCTFMHIYYNFNEVTDEGRKSFIQQTRDVKFDALDSKDFYRVEVSGESFNYPMIWNKPSTSCFISTVPGSIQDFYKMAGIVRQVSSVIPYDRLGVRSVLSNRFFLQNEDYAGEGDFVNKGVLFGYKKIATEHGFQVYENSNALKAGVVFSNFMKRSEYNKLSAKEKDMVLVYALIVEDNQVPEGIGNKGAGSDSSKVASGSLQAGAGSYAGDSGSLSAVTAKDFQALGMTTNEAFQSQCKVMNETATTSFTYTDTKFTYKVAGDGLLFVNIPFSNGYSATVDGKSAELHKVDGGLMAVTLSKGEHQVVLTYREPGFSTGVVLSILGALGIAGLFVWDMKVRHAS